MKAIHRLTAIIMAFSAVSAQAQTYAPPAAMPAPPYLPQAAPAAPYPPPAYPSSAPVAYCQPYSDKFTLAGEVRIVRGTACMHPDGSWELHPVDTGMRYVVREGGLFLVPSQPFAVFITQDHHHHHDRPY